MKRSALLTALAAAALTLSAVQPAAADPAPGQQTQDDAGWALDRIDQPGPAQAPHQYTYTATGAGVDIYIVDSEINTNLSEFGGRARVVYDGVAGQEVPAADANRVPCGGDFDALDPHGTRVAAVAGGATTGVAKGANLLSVVATPCDSDDTPDLNATLRGLRWIRDHHAANPDRPAVVNISLNFPRVACPVWDSRCSDLSALANQLADAGVLVTVSAGNFLTQGAPPLDLLNEVRKNACNTAPSDAARAVVVAASDSQDRHVSNQPATANPSIRWSSAGGACVDLYAPGKSVKTVDSTGALIEDDGTSLAAPMVAGVAALYKETHGDAPSSVIDTWLKTNAVTGISGRPDGTPNRLLNTGGL